MRKILLFLLSVTALSGLGCVQNTTTTNKPTLNTASEKITTETNETAVPTHTVFSIKNLSARIPVTFSYSSENLSYGRILAAFTDQKNRLTILVEPISDAPTKNTAEGDEEVRTQTELKKNQSKIISYTNTSSSKIPFISTRYDVSGESFYKQAEWSHNNDLYTLRFSLSLHTRTESSNSDIQKNIEALNNNINRGEIPEETKKQLQIFNEIISSIYFGEKQGFISSVQHSFVSYPHQTLALIF